MLINYSMKYNIVKGEVILCTELDTNTHSVGVKDIMIILMVVGYGLLSLSL